MGQPDLRGVVTPTGRRIPGGHFKHQKAADDRRAYYDSMCVKLRVEGKTYAEIAKELGWVNANGRPKTSSVAFAVRRALRRYAIAECDTDELLATELQRFDAITARLWPMIESSNNNLSLRAIEKYMLVSERRAKMLGLDKPVAGEHHPIGTWIGARRSTTTTTDAHGNVIRTTTDEMGAVVEGVDPDSMAGKVAEYLSIIDEIVSEEETRADIDTTHDDRRDVIDVAVVLDDDPERPALPRAVDPAIKPVVIEPAPPVVVQPTRVDPGSNGNGHPNGAGS